MYKENGFTTGKLPQCHTHIAYIPLHINTRATLKDIAEAAMFLSTAPYITGQASTLVNVLLKRASTSHTNCLWNYTEPSCRWRHFATVAM